MLGLLASPKSRRKTHSQKVPRFGTFLWPEAEGFPVPSYNPINNHCRNHIPFAGRFGIDHTQQSRLFQYGMNGRHMAVLMGAMKRYDLFRGHDSLRSRDRLALESRSNCLDGVTARNGLILSRSSG